MLNRDYFQGWYFKCNSGAQTIAFIPAFHRNNGKTTFSLQIITDKEAFNIPFDSLKYRENPLFVRLDSNLFSEKGIIIDIHTDKLTAEGTLKFSGITPIGYDIMGPFKFVSFMQCRHSVQYETSNRRTNHS